MALVRRQMLVGGAVNGGRIVSDWPGLAKGSLLDGRDLMPTLALDNLIAAACAESFALEPERLASGAISPQGTQKKLVQGLLRAS